MFLMPMFDPRSSIFGLPANVVIMLAAMGVLVVGFLWIRHIIEPGPFLRGESRWRYRERGRRRSLPTVDPLAQCLAALPHARLVGDPASSLRSPASCSRLANAGAAVNAFSAGGIHGPSTIEILATSGVGYAGILIGIWWMRRIYLAPLETDPAVGWRYRDR